MNNITFYHKTTQGTFVTLSSRPDFSIFEVHQVHGNRIVDLASPSNNAPLEQADGIAIDLASEQIAAIKTADCLPVLLLGIKKNFLLHCGWRGLKSEMINSSEIQNAQIYYALIGPSIQSANYEVTEDFIHHFPKSKNIRFNQGKYYFDLQAEAIKQILQLNRDIQIEDSKECTYANTKYHSYRRNQHQAQRNWNLWIPQSAGVKYGIK